MSMLRPRATAIAVVASVWCVGTLQAQSPQAGGHVHYAEPAAQQASPAGALASRPNLDALPGSSGLLGEGGARLE